MEKIDIKTIEIDGIDMNDYPKFCDAYVTYAKDVNGNVMNEYEIEKWSEENQDIINELAHEKIR